MKATIASLVFVAGAFAAQKLVTTPLQITLFTNLSLSLGAEELLHTSCVVPGGQPSAPALVDFGEQEGTSFVWIVHQAPGTSLALSLSDHAGKVAVSAPFVVNGGGDTSCVGH